MRFRQRPFERMLLVDDRPGNRLDAIAGDKVGKLSGLNAIGSDMFAFHGKLVGQAYSLGAVRSRGSDENLKMNRLAEVGELFPALLAQARLAF